MIFNGVSQPVTETGPDGETTVLPRLEWMRHWLDVHRKLRDVDLNAHFPMAHFLAWEAAHGAWLKDGAPVPRVRWYPSRKPGTSPEGYWAPSSD